MLKNKIKKIFFLRNIKINIINFEVNPDNGGIPDIDKIVNIIVIKKNCKLAKFFNSFNVLNDLKSNTKNNVKMENNKVKYITIFNMNILKPNSVNEWLL